MFVQRGEAHTSKNSEPGREQETTSAERHQVISTKFTCSELNSQMLVSDKHRSGHFHVMQVILCSD